MPIPQPGADESKDDFMSRCMGDDKMMSEYPDQGQRAAVCMNSWSPKMTNELTAEVFASGKWNGMNFDDADLQEIVTAFKKLGDNHRVPLKLGHNDKQPETDGKPALGWVTEVWVSGNKLMAKFSDVPDVLMQAIKKKLYKNVSIELDAGVKYKEDFFKYVLSGVAILGADIPAVNVLADLTAYMSRGATGYTRKSALTFTYIDEDKKMSDEATLKAAQEKAAQLEAKLAALEAEQEATKFTAAKNEFQLKLDAMVKDGIIIPAQREKFMAGVTKDNIESLKFSVTAIAEGAKKPADKSTDAASSRKTDDKPTGTPDQVLFSMAKKLQVSNPKLSFSQAQKQVMESEPELAREYVMMNAGDK